MAAALWELTCEARLDVACLRANVDDETAARAAKDVDAMLPKILKKLRNHAMYGCESARHGKMALEELRRERARGVGVLGGAHAGLGSMLLGVPTNPHPCGFAVLTLAGFPGDADPYANAFIEALRSRPELEGVRIQRDEHTGAMTFDWRPASVAENEGMMPQRAFC